jgi:DMSO/TMAO reductase YedYZ molybdopterin-dependent catalytic subunit
MYPESRWNPFKSRREFFKILAGILMKSAVVAGMVISGVRSAAAFFDRQLLPVGTDPLRLYDEDPEYLDTRNLEITPIVKFDTMGDSRVEVELDKWRLEVTGDVGKPLRLSYPEILKLPSIKKKALLICAGLFSYHAEYTGISLRSLLEMCDASQGASRLAFYGRGEFLVDKSERFSLKEIDENKLFLAYSVNGKPLPRKHGFPLRLVAEDYYGDSWVKYVYKVKID